MPSMFPLPTGLLRADARARADWLPNPYDLAAFALIVAALVLLGHGAAQMRAPLEALGQAPVSLDVRHLPEYGLRTTVRMFAAMAASLLFTFTVATWAAKSRRAGQLIVPALDILQSVPVLGFLTFTVTFFLGLFPGRQLGAELAAIFAIFTSQAWNMAFSFYHALRTVPRDLDEVCRGFGLSAWQRFWRLEAPFAAPGLVWNMMMSMSGGWFFVVASEAITVGDTTVELPGIGSYLALAIRQQDFAAVGWAVLAMAVLIVLYDQLVFRPIVAWADKFRAEQTAGSERPRSWVYDLIRRTRLLKRLGAPLAWMWERSLRLRWSPASGHARRYRGCGCGGGGARRGSGCPCPSISKSRAIHNELISKLFLRPFGCPGVRPDVRRGVRANRAGRGRGSVPPARPPRRVCRTVSALGVRWACGALTYTGAPVNWRIAADVWNRRCGREPRRGAVPGRWPQAPGVPRL